MTDKIDDTISATKHRMHERDGWRRVLAMIEAGEVDVVIVWKIDRLLRNMRDLEDLVNMVIRTGVGIATAEGDIDLSTETGRMVARILAAVAVAEGERKAERQQLSNDQAVMEGSRRFWVRRPFGWVRETGETVPGEAAAIKSAAEAIIDGATLGDIARKWTVEGITTTTGGKWDTRTLGSLFRAPRLAGLMTQHGVIVEGVAGDWRAILTPVTWRTVVRVLDDRAAGKVRAGRTANLLSGIAVCFAPGCDETAQIWWKGGKATGKRYYTCRRGHAMVPADRADAYVADAIISGRQSGWRTGRFTPFRSQAADLTPMIEAERTAADRLAEVREAMAAGTMPIATGSTLAATLERRLTQASDDLARAQAEAARLNDRNALIAEWHALDLGTQRELLRDLGLIVQLRPFVEGEPDERIAIIDPSDEPDAGVLGLLD